MRTTIGLVCALALAACGGGGTAAQSVDANGQHSQAVCGDGVCDSSEIHSCVPDCGTPPPPADAGVSQCGDFVCQPDETPTSCPQDCGGGQPDGGTAAMCSSACDINTILGCILMTCDPTICTGCGLGGGDDSGCDGGASDGTCSAAEASSGMCTTDCPCDFSGTCDPGETNLSCPTDCP